MTIKALYPTVRPTLNLDFAKTKALDPRITFTRLMTGASVATYVGADGLIKTAGNNVPRFDHNPTTGESLGLLVEEDRTNELADSMPTTSGGSGSGITNTAVTGLPGVLSTGRRLTTGGGNDVRINVGFNTLNVVFAYSFFARAGTQGSYIFLRNGTGSFASWNLITNTVTRDDFGTSGIINYGNGWYRCYSVITGSGSSGFLLGVGDSSLNSVNGDNIIIAGVQVERGAFPTSYIPTSGSTVTRAADVASITGANFNVFNSTFVFNGFAALASVNNRRYAEFNGSNGENRLLTNNDFYTSGTSGGNSGSPVSITSDGTMSNYALAFSCDGSVTEKRSAKNGILNSNTSAAGLFLPSDPSFAFGANNSNMAGGYLARKTFKRIAYYPVRLPDAQLQVLTAT